MNDLVQWGIAVILSVQSINPALDPFFKTINFLQTEEFFLIALPVVWWCLDKRVGASLVIVFLFSDFGVRLLKGITNVPRPYDLEPRIRNLDIQPDLSFPSAGAMDTLIFWGYLALRFRKRALWLGAIIAIILLGFTRVYLGVHYPTDVIGSLLIGMMIIAVLVKAEIVERVVATPRLGLWVLAIGFPIVLALIRLNPETAVTLGAMLGFNIGLLIESQSVHFVPHTQWWKQIVKILIGLAVGLVIRLALKPLLPADDLFTFMRYAVIGLWMGVGAPWLFVLARLAGREKPEPATSVHSEMTPAA